MAETAESTSKATSPREIRGDVGAAGGDIHHDGDLKVGGNIRGGMTVVAGGELTVGGSIDAAHVKAARSITVAGAIAGHGKGRCVSGGTVSFRIANGMEIHAAEDVVAVIEIVNCRIIAGGALKCEQGSLHGGHITANGGVICDTLGSPAGMATLIEAGIDERLRRLGETVALEIERNLIKIHRVRTEIAPLLANQKALTAKQKETATEMLFEAGELEEKTETLIRDLRRAADAIRARGKPEVVVNKTLNPGVTVRFDGVETAITEPIAGPVRIWIKPLGHSHQIVLTDLTDNTSHSLMTSAHVDAKLAALKQAIADRKKPAS
jgi:hypothetical protein